MTNKYIIRVYWLVCSWRSRGGFVIKVDDFRKIMGITQRYTRIDNIISKIIVPSQRYMRDNFPIWFEYRFHDEPYYWHIHTVVLYRQKEDKKP